MFPCTQKKDYRVLDLIRQREIQVSCEITVVWFDRVGCDYFVNKTNSVKNNQI